VDGAAAADLQKANEKLMEIQQLNQLLEIARAAPNWSTTLDKLSLVPSRASEIRDHKEMQSLHTQQTKYLQLLREKLGILLENEDEADAEKEAAKQLMQIENKKLNLIEAKLRIYETVLENDSAVSFNDDMTVSFNELWLAAGHNSRNNTNAVRVIISFDQARVLLENISLRDLIRHPNIVVCDIDKIAEWNYRENCYFIMDSFKPGTKEVTTFPVRTSRLHIRFLEASWPADDSIHRLEPLPGSIRKLFSKKRLHNESSWELHDQQQNEAQKYAKMLLKLTDQIQSFLVLSDSVEDDRAYKSLALLKKTPEGLGDNLICMWVEELQEWHADASEWHASEW